jgi:cell division protein FtsX
MMGRAAAMTRMSVMVVVVVLVGTLLSSMLVVLVGVTRKVLTREERQSSEFAYIHLEYCRLPCTTRVRQTIESAHAQLPWDCRRPRR